LEGDEVVDVERVRDDLEEDRERCAWEEDSTTSGEDDLGEAERLWSFSLSRLSLDELCFRVGSTFSFSTSCSFPPSTSAFDFGSSSLVVGALESASIGRSDSVASAGAKRNVTKE